MAKEVDPTEFYQDVVQDDQDPDQMEYEMELDNGSIMTVTLQEVDIDELFDDIKQLPDGIKRMIVGMDDPEDVEDSSAEASMLMEMDGDMIRAFRSICTKGIQHDTLTSQNIKQMVQEFGLEPLFEASMRILMMSLENDGRIKGFRERDSDTSTS